MEIISYKEFMQSNIKLPDRVVITDNGAYDLDKRGIKGKYIWIGYRHSGSKSESRMNSIIRKVANQISEWLGSKYNSEPHIEDYTRLTDMCRVWIGG